jgi:hypothetical protein
MVREYRPMKRTIRFKGKDKLIQLPYVIFAFDQGSLLVGVSNRPIRDLSDPVYFPPFGNMYPDNRVCGSAGATLQDAIQRFWQTSFNADLSTGHLVRKLWFGGYRAWSELSKDANAEQRVLNRVSGTDYQTFSQFIRIYRSSWGRWRLHLDEEIQGLPKADPFIVIPANCHGCPVRFVCPGCTVPTSWSMIKWVWRKFKMAIRVITPGSIYN